MWDILQGFPGTGKNEASLALTLCPTRTSQAPAVTATVGSSALAAANLALRTTQFRYFPFSLRLNELIDALRLVDHILQRVPGYASSLAELLPGA